MQLSGFRNLCPPEVDEDGVEVVVAPPVTKNNGPRTYNGSRAYNGSKTNNKLKDVYLREGPIGFTVNGEQVQGTVMMTTQFVLV